MMITKWELSHRHSTHGLSAMSIDSTLTCQPHGNLPCMIHVGDKTPIPGKLCLESATRSDQCDCMRRLTTNRSLSYDPSTAYCILENK